MERIEVNVLTGEQRTVPLSAAEIEEVQNRPVLVPTIEQQRAARASAFTAEADPLFFQVQRGEADQADYDAKVIEIRQRYPYPSEAQS